MTGKRMKHLGAIVVLLSISQRFAWSAEDCTCNGVDTVIRPANPVAVDSCECDSVVSADASLTCCTDGTTATASVGECQASRDGNYTVPVKTMLSSAGCCDITQVELVSGGDITCSAQGCPSGKPLPGGVKMEGPDLKVKWSMGYDPQGKLAGLIYLDAEEVTANLSTPAALEAIPGVNLTIEVVYDSSNPAVLRQVWAPECLANIVTNGAEEYTISFYPADNVTHNDGTGLYDFTGDPIAVYTVGDPGVEDAMRIVKSVGGSTTTNDLAWSTDDGTNEWAITTGGGARVDVSLVSSNAIGVVTAEIVKNSSGEVVSHVRRQWSEVAGVERLVEEVVDPDGAALTTTRTYYTNGSVACVVQPDGAWTRYEYDAAGRQTVVLRSWLDAGTNASADSVRTTYYSYSAADTNDDLSVKNWKPRSVLETVEGTAVAKTLYSYYENVLGERYEIVERCAATSAVWGAEGNLRTETIFYPEQEGSASSERVKRRTDPLGLTSSYEYDFGHYVTNITNNTLGDYTFTLDATGSYLRVTTTMGTTNSLSGVASNTTREVTVGTAGGREVMRETFVCVGSTNYDRIAWTQTFLDAQGRALSVHKSDGSTWEGDWDDCCGLVWDEDAEGTERRYTYNELGMRDSSTLEGKDAQEADIVTSHIFDPMGRELRATVAAGAISRISSNAYDVAGRLTQSWQADGTTVSYQYGSLTTAVVRAGVTNTTIRYRDGSTRRTLVNGVVQSAYAYGVNPDGTRYTTTWSGPDGTNSSQFATTVTDVLGRTLREERPAFGGGTLTNAYEYAANGKLTKLSPASGAATLYEYDQLGNVVRSGLDIDGDGTLDLGESDRVTDSHSQYEEMAGAWWRTTRSVLYAQDGSAAATTTSVQRVRLTGLSDETRSETKSVDVRGNETVTSTAVDRDAKTVTRTTDYPDSITNAVTLTVNTRLTQQTTREGLVHEYGYDAIGRRVTATDPRIGTATTAYDPDTGRVAYTEDPAGNRTWMSYDPDTGQRTAVSNALGLVTRYEYDARGRLVKTWGDGAYPVSYAYDDLGRMTSMSTYREGSGWSGPAWPASPGTADTTTWQYDEATGLLTNKVYADGKGVGYDYAPDGRLAARTWARGEAAQYAYDPCCGALTNIDYSAAGTPDVSFTYDRLGRQETVTDAAGTRTFQYGPYLQLTNETLVGSAALVAGQTNLIARSYDAYGRSTGFDLEMGPVGGHSIEYTYDTYGRMNQVGWTLPGAGSSTATYSRVSNSDLVEGWTIPAGASQFSFARGYESDRNLIAGVTNKHGASVISAFGYGNDAIGRRTAMTQTGTAFKHSDQSTQYDMSAFWDYGYNTRSELTSGKRYWGTDTGDTGSPVAGQSWAYVYDNIGNRTSVTHNAETLGYTANQLNQYVSREVLDEVDVLGYASTQAVVTVNNEATTRQGAYYHKALQTNNTASAAYPGITVVGVHNPPGTNDDDVVMIDSGRVFVARTPESFTYDDDGNLLTDGRWVYSWNAENRLTNATTSAAAVAAGVPRVSVSFLYDYMGRRVRKRVLSDYSGGYQATNTWLFVYDGWNLVAEAHTVAEASATTATTNRYAWGLDLSGSLQGAGGIGGLLARADGSDLLLYCYDANGNVSDMIATDGTIEAHYEYDPFGNTIAAYGDSADANPFRFSTKYFDDEVDLYYYGLRSYKPSMARWPSRDPMGEGGGYNLYVFLMNDPVDWVDLLGLSVLDRVKGIINGWIVGAVIEMRSYSDAKANAVHLYTKYKRDCPSGCESVVFARRLTLDGYRIDYRIGPPVIGFSSKKYSFVGVILEEWHRCCCRKKDWWEDPAGMDGSGWSSTVESLVNSSWSGDLAIKLWDYKEMHDRRYDRCAGRCTGGAVTTETTIGVPLLWELYP